MEREVFLEKRIRELANTSYQRGIGTFSDFLNLSEQDLLYKISPLKHYGVYSCLWGGYPDAERCICAFLPDLERRSTDREADESAGPHPDSHGMIRCNPESYGFASPVCCVRIGIRNLKYTKELTHRDYLGSILGQGVERSVIGDILVDEEGAYFFCDSKIAGFLIENLRQVRRTDVELCMADPEEIPKPNFETITGTVASIRLDSLVAAAFRLSRQAASDQIGAGLVYVNGKLTLSHSYSPSPGDIISVRHMGRFRLEEETGKTRKGRLGIRIAKYV